MASFLAGQTRRPAQSHAPDSVWTSSPMTRRARVSSWAGFPVARTRPEQSTFRSSARASADN